MREKRARPEGWRTLRVGALELWWSAGEPRVTAQLPDEAGAALTQAIAVTLAIERADGSGKKLVATLRGRRPLTRPGATAVVVDPETVRRIVEVAAPRGAWPTGAGTVRLDGVLR